MARVYGANVQLFSKFENRADCSRALVHRPRRAGIDGSSEFGACSIVLSGRYADDEDRGNVIVYTGSGGREEWGEVEIRDQSWDVYPNKLLEISRVLGNDIRVIRSSNSNSPYAPVHGYRYDGLYRITECWTAKGINGFQICRCRLERQPNQPPIPLHPHRAYAVIGLDIDWGQRGRK